MNLREISFLLDAMVVDGLACKCCVRKALDQLRATDGVVAVSVGTTTLQNSPDAEELGLATLRYNPEFTNAATLRSLLEETLGFRVREVREAGQAPKRAQANSRRSH